MLIVGPGSKDLSAHRDAIGAFLKAGGHLLAIGLTQEDADALLPFKVSMKPGRTHQRVLRSAGGELAAGGRRAGGRA